MRVPAPASPKRKRSAGMRILTFNIWVGGEGRLPLIRDVIRRQEPDVVAIQEANDQGNVAALARDLEMELVCGAANTKYSVAWLSRLPIRRAENHRRAVFRKTLLEIEVEWQGTPLRLFAAHLKAKVANERYRAHEVAALLEIVGAATGTPHLLVGDFNAIAPGDVFAPDAPVTPATAEWAPLAYAAPRLAIAPILAAGYTDCYRALHPDRPGYTCKTTDPSVRIDYVFASPELAPRLHACDVATSPPASAASDHFPVMAQFA